MFFLSPACRIKYFKTLFFYAIFTANAEVINFIFFNLRNLYLQTLLNIVLTEYLVHITLRGVTVQYVVFFGRAANLRVAPSGTHSSYATVSHVQFVWLFLFSTFFFKTRHIRWCTIVINTIHKKGVPRNSVRTFLCKYTIKLLMDTSKVLYICTVCMIYKLKSTMWINMCHYLY